MRRHWTICLLAVVILGCYIPAPAAENDAAALRRQLTQFDRDVAAGNLEGLISLFAEDAVVLGSGQAPVTGKAAVRAWWKGILEQFDVKGVHELGEITTMGDAVVLQGKGRGSLIPKGGGKAVPIDTWFLHIYRRQADGSLRFWRGAFGPNTAAAELRLAK